MVVFRAIRRGGAEFRGGPQYILDCLTFRGYRVTGQRPNQAGSRYSHRARPPTGRRDAQPVADSETREGQGARTQELLQLHKRSKNDDHAYRDTRPGALVAFFCARCDEGCLPCVAGAGRGEPLEVAQK